MAVVVLHFSFTKGLRRAFALLALAYQRDIAQFFRLLERQLNDAHHLRRVVRELDGREHLAHIVRCRTCRLHPHFARRDQLVIAIRWHKRFHVDDDLRAG